MSELTEFILARIAEDEARANHAKWAMQGEWFTTADDKVDEYVRGLSPARVLAECAAKRRIVYAAMQSQESLDRRRPPATDAINGHVIAYRDVVRQLAAAYSDHPDYRPEEWV